MSCHQLTESKAYKAMLKFLNILIWNPGPRGLHEILAVAGSYGKSYPQA